MLRFLIRVVFSFLLILFFTPKTFTQISSGSELSFGIQDYRHARFQEAAQHFQNAVLADPQDPRGHLYLATTLAQLYIPGVDEPTNIQFAKKAIEQYQELARLSPHSSDAVEGIANLYFQMKEFEKAKEYYQQASGIEPANAKNYYFRAIINWTQAYTNRMKLRNGLQLKPDEPLIGNGHCFELRNSNEKLVAEGIQLLVQTLRIQPDDDDAMAYMNLMYRERADVECGDKSAFDSDILTADKWVDISVQTKRLKSKKHSSNVAPPSNPQRQQATSENVP